jgi:hypothetical protein
VAHQTDKISIEPAQPKPNSLEALVIPSCLIQSPLQSMIFPENVQDWTETHVHQWLFENNLPQMARILSGMDGLKLIYFSEYIITSEPQQILSLLQQDSLRRINENISLIEISCFRSLIERKNLAMFTPIKQLKQVNRKNRDSNYSTCCIIL